MILIKDGRVVDPASGVDEGLDVVLEDGRVKALGKFPKTEDYQRVIDAKGKIVAPGLVDIHVHFRDPGLTYKEDIITGCAAAARGGVTSVACMANTSPAIDCPELVSYVYNRAKEANGVGVYPIAALSQGLRDRKSVV